MVHVHHSDCVTGIGGQSCSFQTNSHDVLFFRKGDLCTVCTFCIKLHNEYSSFVFFIVKMCLNKYDTEMGQNCFNAHCLL